MKSADCRDREALVEAMRAGEHPKFLMFWGHTPQTSGCIDRSCLSNWFPASFEIDDEFYPTSEHYMMAQKARMFGDSGMLNAIRKSETPGEAKKLGRRVANFNQAVWEEHRFHIVVQANEAKFSQNEEMGHFLISTGNQVLVEASPRDRIWGIGMGASNPLANDPSHWNGRNLLGFALMEVRSRLH